MSDFILQQAHIPELDEVCDLAHEIYDSLPKETDSNHIVIRSVYGRQAIDFAKEIGGITSLRLWWVGNHFGNPFSHEARLVAKNKDLTFVPTTKDAVLHYIHWCLTSDHHRAKWLREQCISKVHAGKPIHYYKELGEPSHANALDYLINDFDWSLT